MLNLKTILKVMGDNLRNGINPLDGKRYVPEHVRVPATLPVVEKGQKSVRISIGYLADSKSGHVGFDIKYH